MPKAITARSKSHIEASQEIFDQLEDLLMDEAREAERLRMEHLDWEIEMEMGYPM